MHRMLVKWQHEAAILEARSRLYKLAGVSADLQILTEQLFVCRTGFQGLLAPLVADAQEHRGSD
jgi:hypothetical protein